MTILQIYINRIVPIEPEGETPVPRHGGCKAAGPITRERVKDGAGQVVLLSGEPGIGKSRLVEALKETVEREGARCLELRCSPYTQNSALAPVIEYFQRTLHFRPEDSADEKLHKLSVGALSSLLQAEAIPLLSCFRTEPRDKRFLRFLFLLLGTESQWRIVSRMRQRQ